MRKVVVGLSLAFLMLAVFLLVTAPVTAENTGVFVNYNDISRAQRILAQEGYLEPRSYKVGELDSTTQNALTLYQIEHSLNNHGKLDDDTFQMLLSHDMSHPWGTGQPVAVAQSEPTPQVEAKPAPPVRPAEPAPPAPPVTTTPPAPVKPVAPPEPVIEEREMPRTASPLPFLALSGLLLLTAGMVVLRSRRA